MKNPLRICPAIIVALSIATFARAEKTIIPHDEATPPDKKYQTPMKTRNVITGLPPVDWSDATRQNEFVQCVISALSAAGENFSYDDLCVFSGSSFRTVFSDYDAEKGGFNHGNYTIQNALWTVAQAFTLLGYDITLHPRSDFATDKTLIMQSIDRGMPVLILNGIIDTSECCVITGYDDAGNALLGLSAFTCCSRDFEKDETGYFLKRGWHDQKMFARHGAIVIIQGKTEKPGQDELYKTVAANAIRLIKGDKEPGQHMGLDAHTAYALALFQATPGQIDVLYFNMLCNNKMYIDKIFAAKFFQSHGRPELAALYQQIGRLVHDLHTLIPHDFQHAHLLNDKKTVLEFCHRLLSIRDLEAQACALLANDTK